MGGIITLEIEKERDYVTPDGMVKEGPEETAHGWSCLISLKRSSPWEEKESHKDFPGSLKEVESQKDSPGLKEKSEEIAASEQNTSKGKDRSLPCSNKKRKRKTWITELAAKVCILIAYEPKNKWIRLLITFGMLLSGAYGKGVNVQREDFRSIAIATSETEVATYSVPTPVDGANYLIYAGNKPGSFKCTPEFVEFNKSCTLEVGDKDKTECEGLQIFRNETHTHLTVDGSKLTHDCTAFCILQHFPTLHTLYPLAVFKEHDQASDLKYGILIAVAVIAIGLAILFAFLYIRQRLRSKSTVIMTEMKTTIAYEDDPKMSNGSPA